MKLSAKVSQAIEMFRLETALSDKSDELGRMAGNARRLRYALWDDMTTDEWEEYLKAEKVEKGEDEAEAVGFNGKGMKAVKCHADGSPCKV